MKDCFALKYGKCVALNCTICEGCSFYKTKEQLKDELQNSKKRLKQLGKEEQMYIRDKYYGGK